MNEANLTCVVWADAALVSSCDPVQKTAGAYQLTFGYENPLVFKTEEGKKFRRYYHNLTNQGTNDFTDVPEAYIIAKISRKIKLPKSWEKYMVQKEGL